MFDMAIAVVVYLTVGLLAVSVGGKPASMVIAWPLYFARIL